MIIYLTGGLGFIGSNLIRQLNKLGTDRIIIIDRFDDPEKWKNIKDLKFLDIVDPSREDYIKFDTADYLIHLGAVTNTKSENIDDIWHNNVVFSKNILGKALTVNCKGICFASSASIYGNTDNFVDTQSYDKLITYPETLNPYAWSKKQVEYWISKNKFEDKILTFRFFNVWGKNEGHKEKLGMASPIHTFTKKILNNEPIHIYTEKDKKMARDFIYVKDVVNSMIFGIEKGIKGTYNLGSGTALEWPELISKMCSVLGKDAEVIIEDIPEKLKNGYQYYTKADMIKFNLKFSLFFNAFEDSYKDYLNDQNLL
jgi:ADP-L-glycero-D-manno-heptose 6-epimerase